MVVLDTSPDSGLMGLVVKVYTKSAKQLAQEGGNLQGLDIDSRADMRQCVVLWNRPPPLYVGEGCFHNVPISWLLVKHRAAKQ